MPLISVGSLLHRTNPIDRNPLDFGVDSKKGTLAGGSIAQWLADLLPDTATLCQFPALSKIISEEKCPYY